MKGLRSCVGLLLLLSVAKPLIAQGLEAQLKALGPNQLAIEARQFGDPARGAVVFYQAYMACVRCHTPDENSQQLGPALTQPEEGSSDADVVESILEPSKKIRRGFEPVQIVTTDGEILQGLVSRETEDSVLLRDAGRDFKEVELSQEIIEERAVATVSMMPAGLANALTSRQQFLDLVRYVLEIREGGVARMRQLEPPPASYAARPLPEYESHIDHAGLIRAWDDEAYQRGETIYSRLCVNCHGTISQPGSLPTSLRFAEGRFKNGSDPLTMYQTLTRGFGMMVAQTWMVPSQKYDVIHYIRETYLREHNPSQYVTVSDTYLAGLPAGDTFGPEPSNVLEWEQMDYGPNLVMTLEFGKDGSNIAQKANAIRLDAGPGGVSQGKYWMAYDYDTMRMAGAWSGDQFCDWHGINFDGGHGTHPRATGMVHASNPTGPGWGRPGDGSFVDESRVRGRDGRQYGPLPRGWAQYKGMYYHGPNTLIEYTVGTTRILEMPSVIPHDNSPVFLRTLNIGPRDQQLVLQVAHLPDARLTKRAGGGQEYVTFSRATKESGEEAESPGHEASEWDGTRYWQVADIEGLPINQADFTWTARIKTDQDGTILAQTTTEAEWKPMGLTWFLRGGRLTVDIGWVGAVQGRRRVTDNLWHDVAMTYHATTGEIAFFVDGQLDAVAGRLKRKTPLEDAVLRIGYTSENFPDPSAFRGLIADVKYYKGLVLSAKQTSPRADAKLLAHWPLQGAAGTKQSNVVSERYPLTLKMAGESGTSDAGNLPLVAGCLGTSEKLRWEAVDDALRLTIPPGKEPLRMTIWLANAADDDASHEVAARVVIDQPAPDLTELTRGGPARWPQELMTTVTLGNSDQPFAIDDLTRPADNPWFCRMRLTGLDFLPGGDQMVVSAWDGNVWLVSGLKGLDEAAAKGDANCQISWRRIASGLFQPLGIKYHQGLIYVICRDELCVLHDLNDDGEIDGYECFNNDHQVTEHFHEFAMGLQVDDAGSFYYAKSARHALKAVVPHHGTLLRISPDGALTEIVATGFRAANGICLNPDGSFIVTDQEGHWNPKNRINYVRRGGFYGNMFGYHDVTDESDDAMEQPLCWITNDFDRSPGELLWVTSDAWGPLKGQLLNLSYGYGMIYVVPHEIVHGQPQGGMAEFPITRLPTGVMRGRFSPDDGQLYTCGMFAWAGNQTQPGGLYRVRYTGAPIHLPIALRARDREIEITLSGEVDREVASDAENYQIKVWSLKRTANYGSQHYDEHPLTVTSATVSADGRTVLLTVPELAPTWGMEIRYRLKSSSGQSIDGRIHNTIHELPPPGGL